MFKKSLTMAVMAVSPLIAQSAGLHDGDVILAVNPSNQIVIESASLFHGVNGYAIFEGDFGDLAGGPFRTDDPGFDTEPGSFANGTLVNYQALGSLQFWNGSLWSSTVPGGEYVRLDGNLGEEVRWTTSGLLGDTSGLIGQAGPTGQIHEHLDIRVARELGGAPAVGAYLIQLQINAQGYQSSDPFYMVFNRGLSASAFEASVDALVTPVPEPGTWALLLAGLAVVGVAAQRRRA